MGAQPSQTRRVRSESGHRRRARSRVTRSEIVRTYKIASRYDIDDVKIVFPPRQHKH